MSPSELLAQSQAVTDEADASVDPDDLGYVPDIVGVDISVADCANATSYVTTTTSLGVDLDGKVTSVDAGDMMLGTYMGFLTDSGSDSTNQSTPPSLSATVKRPAIAHGDYGRSVPDHADSSFGAVFWVFDTVDRDTRGRPIVYWQNADMSAGDSVNFLSGVARIYHNGRHYFEDSTPFATKTFDSETFDAEVDFGVEKKDTSSAGVKLSRTFTVSNTKYGGHRERTDNGFTYAVDGGYLKISRGHRNESREWSQGGAWVFPPGMDINASISVAIEYKSR